MATYQEQIRRRAVEREAKEKAEAERLANQMTPEQIKNWRQILLHMVGPFALLMEDEMVQEFRDRIQARVHEELNAPSAAGDADK